MAQAQPTPTEEALPVVIAAPDAVVSRFVEQGAGLAERAEMVQVENVTGVEVAKVILDDVKRLRAEVERDLGEPKSAAHKLHKMLSATYNKHSEPLNRIEKLVKDKIGIFVEEQERQARVAAAEAEAAARKVEEDARLAEAAALEEAGAHDEAEEVLREELPPPPPTKTTPVKVAGISTRQIWRAEVTSATQLAVAAAEGHEVALSILTDPKVVAAMNSVASAKAKALKQHLKVPGVRVTSEKSTAHRAAS